MDTIDFTNKIEREEENFETSEQRRADEEDRGLDKKTFSIDKATLNLINICSKRQGKPNYGPTESHNPRLLMSRYEIDPVEQVYLNEQNILKIQNNW